MHVRIFTPNKVKYENSEITFNDGFNGGTSESNNKVIIPAKPVDYFFLHELHKAIREALVDIDRDKREKMDELMKQQEERKDG